LIIEGTLDFVFQPRTPGWHRPLAGTEAGQCPWNTSATWTAKDLLCPGSRTTKTTFLQSEWSTHRISKRNDNPLVQFLRPVPVQCHRSITGNSPTR